MFQIRYFPSSSLFLAPCRSAPDSCHCPVMTPARGAGDICLFPAVARLVGEGGTSCHPPFPGRPGLSQPRLQLIESLIFPSSLAVRIWVAPSPAPSGCADLAFSGCPASASFGDSGNVSPGCPAAYVLQLYRRWIFESPRISHPSAALVVKFRVAPNLRSPTPPLMRPQVALSPASSGCQR